MNSSKNGHQERRKKQMNPRRRRQQQNLLKELRQQASIIAVVPKILVPIEEKLAEPKRAMAQDVSVETSKKLAIRTKNKGI